MGGELGPTTVGRLAACLFIASGTLTVVTLPLPQPPGMNERATFLVGLAAIVVGFVAYVAPWHRWSRNASLAMIPVAFALIALGNVYGSTRSYSYSLFFIVAFTWVGLAHPRWTSLPLALPAAAAYVTPMFIRPELERTDALDALLAIPVCILVAEIIAWTVARERKSRRSAAALAHVASELGQHLDEDHLSQSLVEHARRALQCDHAVLLRIEPIALTVVHVHSSGTPEALRETIARMHGVKLESIPEQLLRGDPMVVSDTADDPNLAELIMRFNVKSFLTVPVLARGLLVAILSCWESSHVRAYDADDVALARALAGQASAAIENARLYMQTVEASRRDPLTGLPNRRAFRERLDAEIERAVRHGRPLSLAVLDCDRFKRVNDSLGHQTGDRVLERIGELLQRNRRTEDEIYRIGGDEFAALLPETGPAGATVVAERLRRSIRRAGLGPDGITDPLTASFGIACVGLNAVTAVDLFHEADQALYEVKRAGGDACAVAPRKRAGTTTTLGVDVQAVIESELVNAIYQPLFDVEHGNVIGFEALVRVDPVLGHTPTRTLFRAAASIGRADALDEVCRRAAMRSAAELPVETSLFINVSPAAMASPGVLAGRLAAAADEAALGHERVVVEVIDDDRTPSHLDVLRGLRACQHEGFPIAMDDFTGKPADIDLLSAVAFDYVKIDMSFGAATSASESRRAVLRGLAHLISETGARSIASGVETMDDLRLARELGFFAAQGMFLRAPEPLLNSAPRPLHVPAADAARA